MNIFVLDNDPVVAAKMCCDKHVVKMAIESAQMLSTAIREMYGFDIISKDQKKRKIIKIFNESEDAKIIHWSAHRNHPCTLWASESIENFLWLYNHGKGLCAEHIYRWDKIPSSLSVLESCRTTLQLCTNLMSDLEIPTIGLTPFVQAMPEQYKCDDAVLAYRNYYLGEKKRFAKWTKRKPPEWWNQLA